MSVLIALKKDGIVYMGGDSEVFKKGLIASRTNRIWEVPKSGGLLIGCIGSIGVISSLKNQKLFDNSWFSDEIFSFDFARTTLNFRIRNHIKNSAIDDENYYEHEDGTIDIGASFFAAKADCLCYISSIGEVFEIDDFCVIGQGANQAYECLLSTASVEDPMERIKKALQASGSINYPAIIKNSLNRAETIIYE